jgi:hypothetical protein
MSESHWCGQTVYMGTSFPCPPYPQLTWVGADVATVPVCLYTVVPGAVESTLAVECEGRQA